MIRLLLVALALVATVPAAAQVPAEPEPRFEGAFALPYIVCDCDPTDFVFRTTTSLQGYAEPSASGPVIRVVQPGRLIGGNDWDRVLSVTTRPQVAVAERDLTLEYVTRFGPVRYIDDPYDENLEVTTLTIPAGSTIELMDAEAGTAFFRFDGEMYSTGEFAGIRVEDPDAYTPEETWYRLVPRGGRPAAWVRLEPDWSGRGEGNVEPLCNTHDPCDE